MAALSTIPRIGRTITVTLHKNDVPIGQYLRDNRIVLVSNRLPEGKRWLFPMETPSAYQWSFHIPEDEDRSRLERYGRFIQDLNKNTGRSGKKSPDDLEALRVQMSIKYFGKDELLGTLGSVVTPFDRLGADSEIDYSFWLQEGEALCAEAVDPKVKLFPSNASENWIAFGDQFPFFPRDEIAVRDIFRALKYPEKMMEVVPEKYEDALEWLRTNPALVWARDNHPEALKPLEGRIEELRA